MKPIHYSRLIQRFAQQHSFRIVLTLVVSLLANLITIFLPIYIALSFELLFNIKSHRAKVLFFLPDWILQSFSNYFLVFLFVLTLYSLFDFLKRYSTSYLGELHLVFLRKEIFEHQLNTHMRVFDEKGVGKYLLRYSGDLSSIQALITKGTIGFISDIILIIITLSVLLSINNLIGTLVFAAILVLSFTTFLLNQLLYFASVNRRNAKSGLLKFVTLRLQNMLTIKSFNRLVPELKQFNKRVDKLLILGKRYHGIRSLIGAIIPLGLYLMIGMVMQGVMYLKQLDQNTIAPEAFFMAILLIITVLPVFRRCFRVSMIWRNGTISYDKLTKILNLDKEAYLHQPDFHLENGSITLKQLSFGYTNQSTLFQNLNLKFPNGTISIIQGSTGSGKTTLLKLLNGLYQSNQGEIEIDGQSISSINPKSLRKHIAIVAEEWTLLGRNVFEALSYSRKETKRVGVYAQLRALKLTDTLQLNSPIGEHGRNLSKGQQKLLQYGRAFLTKKPILLIDAPWSGLDKKSIALIVDLLNKKKEKHTIILFTNQPIPLSLKVDAFYQLQKQFHRNSIG